MSAMLRAAGPDFDVDRFLADCTLSVSSIHRKGHRRGGPKSPKHERSGLNVLVSEATFEQFPRQTEDAIVFLRKHGKEVRRLSQFPGVDVVSLDFGIARRDVAVQSTYLNAELIHLAGRLGLAIELSHYPPLDSEGSR